MRVPPFPTFGHVRILRRGVNSRRVIRDNLTRACERASVRDTSGFRFKLPPSRRSRAPRPPKLIKRKIRLIPRLAIHSLALARIAGITRTGNAPKFRLNHLADHVERITRCLFGRAGKFRTVPPLAAAGKFCISGNDYSPYRRGSFFSLALFFLFGSIARASRDFNEEPPFVRAASSGGSTNARNGRSLIYDGDS